MRCTQIKHTDVPYCKYSGKSDEVRIFRSVYFHSGYSQSLALYHIAWSKLVPVCVYYSSQTEQGFGYRLAFIMYQKS